MYSFLLFKCVLDNLSRLQVQLYIYSILPSSLIFIINKDYIDLLKQINNNNNE